MGILSLTQALLETSSAHPGLNVTAACVMADAQVGDAAQSDRQRRLFERGLDGMWASCRGAAQARNEADRQQEESKLGSSWPQVGRRILSSRSALAGAILDPNTWRRGLFLANTRHRLRLLPDGLAHEQAERATTSSARISGVECSSI